MKKSAPFCALSFLALSIFSPESRVSREAMHAGMLLVIWSLHCVCVFSGFLAAGHQIITSLFGVPRRLDHYLITLGVCEADLRKCQPTISTALEEILEKLLVCPQSCPTLPVESSTPSFSSHVSSQHEVVANTIKVGYRIRMPVLLLFHSAAVWPEKYMMPQ